MLKGSGKMKIIGVLNPFDLIQTFYVYKDGEQIDIMQGKMKDVSEIIFTLSQKHNINQIDLSGPKVYVKGIVKKIKKQEMQKYSKDTLKFNFI